MYIPNYPEDSTLRRHYESAAALRRQARLAQPPTDSVLRRHYEQLNGAASAAPADAKPATAESPAPAAPQPQPQPEPRRQSAAPAVEPTSSGGLFGWLKRLFG